MRIISSTEPIACLGLSLRTYNALRRAGIDTIGELIGAEKQGEIIKIRNIGEKSYKEIVNKIINYRLCDIENSYDSFNKPKKSVNENDNAKPIKEQIKHTNDILEELYKWQIDLLMKQINLRTLHEDVIISGKSLGTILNEEFKGNLEIIRIFSIILGSTCVTEELNHLIDGISTRDINIYCRYYGLTKRTLEEIAEPLEITRERVRQILTRVKQLNLKKIRKIIIKRKGYIPKTTLPRIQTALLLAKQQGSDITYNDWSRQITLSGLLGNWEIKTVVSWDPIELLIAVCKPLSESKIKNLRIPENLQYACDLAGSGKPDKPAKYLLIRKTLDKEVRRKINRHYRYSGGVNSKWLSQEIGISLSATIDILEALGYIQASSEWFILERAQRDLTPNKNQVLEHTLRKMTQYCGPMKLEDICSGLRYAVSRTEFPVPPPNVLKTILEKKGYSSEEGLWFWNGKIDEELSHGERIIFGCLSEKGTVVHHSELAQAFIESELSFAALHATLNRTPLIERFDHALYKLRGLEVSYDEIKRANNEGDRVPVNLDIVPEKTGIIMIYGSLGILPIGTGVFFSENLPKLVGKWHGVVNGSKFGDIKVTENEIRGLLVPFKQLKCEVGDRVCMSFNTWDRTVSIEKIHNDEN